MSPAADPQGIARHTLGPRQPHHSGTLVSLRESCSPSPPSSALGRSISSQGLGRVGESLLQLGRWPVRDMHALARLCAVLPDGPEGTMQTLAHESFLCFQTVIKEGMLTKQNNSFQRSKRRYFKLRGRTLYYAKTAKVRCGGGAAGERVPTGSASWEKPSLLGSVTSNEFGNTLGC